MERPGSGPANMLLPAQHIVSFAGNRERRPSTIKWCWIKHSVKDKYAPKFSIWGQECFWVLPND